MPFQPGNTEASKRGKDKPYRDALRRAIARAQESDNPHALDRIADKHLAQCASGDMQAIKELADRLDGKPAQAIVGDDEEAPIRVHSIERRIVDPANRDSESVPPAA